MQERPHHTVVTLVIGDRLIQTTRKLSWFNPFPWKGTATVRLREAKVRATSKDNNTSVTSPYIIRDRRKFKLRPNLRVLYLGQDSKEHKKNSIDKSICRADTETQV